MHTSSVTAPLTTIHTCSETNAPAFAAYVRFYLVQNVYLPVYETAAREHGLSQYTYRADPYLQTLAEIPVS